MEKLATNLLNSVSEWVKSNPDTVSNMLTAGGVGALLGGIMPASSDDKEESASSRVLRRVKNALIGGALGVGGMGLLNYGLNQFKTAIPAEEPTTTKAMGNAASSGLARAGYGAGALGTVGAITETMRRKARRNLVKDLKLKGDSMSNTEKLLKAYGADPSAFKTVAKMYLPKGVDVQRRLAKMNVLTESGFWKKTLQALRNNKARGVTGLALAGLAATAPDIVSWATSD